MKQMKLNQSKKTWTHNLNDINTSRQVGEEMNNTKLRIIRRRNTYVFKTKSNQGS